jgi:hypothetical protein
MSIQGDLQLQITNSSIGGDELYAKADSWSLTDIAGKITDIDVGFAIELERHAFKVSYLEDLLSKLGSKRKA